MITLKELKERRLVQIVVSYAVAGWVVLSIFGEVIDRGVLPEIVYRVLLVLYFGGLVASVVSGWFHGEKGIQRVTRSEVVLLTVVALTTLGFATRTVQDHLSTEARKEIGAAAGFDPTRLAVLYFRDQSRGKDLSYLADGITESLIDQLSSSQALTVLSKSASERFRDSTVPLDSVARVLRSGTLVDGYVEDRGDQVRVGVTLVDGATGADLKSETLDRPADDVFGLQDDLAKEVGVLLKEWLGEEIEVREVRRGTESVAAWALFQRGEHRRDEGERAFQEGDSTGLARSFRAADSLYAEAAQADPGWSSPLSRRASLAARWADLTIMRDPQQAAGWANAGLAYADQALSLDPRSAGAYLVKGALEYFRWSNGLLPNPDEADEAFENAKSDLKQATTLDGGLAQAWNLLSIVYSQEPDLIEANLAARRALEADEFFRSASDVLVRLYATSYDLENMRDAEQYCAQGRSRFPGNPVFRECRLWLMSAPYPQAPSPDPDEAWQVLDQYLELVPDQFKPFERLKGQILVAGVLARAELTDSAEAVLSRSRSTPAVDPEMELLGVEALVRLHLLGEKEQALSLLKTYLTANPGHRQGWRWTQHWWWRPLQADSEFQALVGR